MSTTRVFKLHVDGNWVYEQRLHFVELFVKLERMRLKNKYDEIFNNIVFSIFVLTKFKFFWNKWDVVFFKVSFNNAQYSQRMKSFFSFFFF